MLLELLAQRGLCDALTMDDGTPCTSERWPDRRAELIEALARTIYGTPPRYESASGTTVAAGSEGGVDWRRIRIDVQTRGAKASFPMLLLTPHGASRPPVVLHLTFHPLPDEKTPVELILNRGFALASLVYTDIVDDSHDGKFKNGLGAVLIDGERSPDTTGKLGIWAAGARCALDVLFDIPEVDAGRTALLGHSRLGKTALWAAAQNERFRAVCSVQSGFGGAALAKRGSGEKIADFFKLGSIDWFSPRFASFDGREDELPCDQHFLLSAIAPRPLYVSSASDDRGADPASEFLSCVAASRAYELLGIPGLLTPDRFPTAPCSLHDGRIGYHIRPGKHELARDDWADALDFLAPILLPESQNS